MILILGGTTEGRIAARTLEEAGKPFYYSTKGDEQEVTMHHGIRLQGAMDELDLEHCCREHNIQLLVDAAHPFAIQLHQTVEKVAHTLNSNVFIRHAMKNTSPGAMILKMPSGKSGKKISSPSWH